MSRFLAKQTVAVLKFAGSLSYLRCFLYFAIVYQTLFGWYTKQKKKILKTFLTNYMEAQSIINVFLFFIIC